MINENLDILAKLIAAKGIADSEVQTRLEQWSVDREQGIEMAATKQIQVIGQVEFEREKARLWKESGYAEEYRAALEDAVYVAHAEKLDTLAKQIEAEIHTT